MAVDGGVMETLCAVMDEVWIMCCQLKSKVERQQRAAGLQIRRKGCHHTGRPARSFTLEDQE